MGPERFFSTGFRLQNVTAVNYSEERMPKKKRTSEVEDILLKEGSKPEFYTEEHEELLGSTERSWELFVDGCGNDGKRIYDPIKGKTCHQCRSGSISSLHFCTIVSSLGENLDITESSNLVRFRISILLVKQ